MFLDRRVFRKLLLFKWRDVLMDQLRISAELVINRSGVMLNDCRYHWSSLFLALFALESCLMGEAKCFPKYRLGELRGSPFRIKCLEHTRVLDPKVSFRS